MNFFIVTTYIERQGPKTTNLVQYFIASELISYEGSVFSFRRETTSIQELQGWVSRKKFSKNVSHIVTMERRISYNHAYKAWMATEQLLLSWIKATVSEDVPTNVVGFAKAHDVLGEV